MKFDATFWQRAFLAFTTALFLSCAARVAQTTSVVPSAGFTTSP
jgi:hypothetical protein